ncbi:AAA family ATPase [Mycobacterium sp. NPDC050441]|uniref:AAA family ATPase n=1 Tax=Mycobacterium sp. NPDC050441 TaxID=3155403 RepID=UPI0034044AD2
MKDPTKPAPPGFSSLTIDDWRQFDSVDIRFHPRFTVLTGANASGKSTLLGILGRHFDWRRSYSSEPSGGSKRSRRRWRTLRRRLDQDYAEGQMGDIGTLTYGTGIESPIRVPINDSSQDRSEYDLDIPNQQQVVGVYLTSHRLVSGNYINVNEMPTRFTDANTMFDQFTTEVKRIWMNSARGQSSPQLTFKKALMSAAFFGSSESEYIEINPIARDIWLGYLSILRQVMPSAIDFRSIRVRMPDVIIETQTDDFILDEASGGLSAIMEVAWQIFLRSRVEDRFTVLIDEPENHLHPSLQREIMPSLLRAFPDVQFIVATHSPFVVTSTSESAVYALEKTNSQRVASRALDYANKAASADETLRNVLGVPSTVPKWAEQVFEGIVDRYASQPLDETRLRELRNELRTHGLASGFPDAVIEATADNPFRTP